MRLLVAAYLPPESSDWRRWTHTDPWDRITDILSFLASDPDKTVILVGDLNMRTGQLQASPQPSDLPRVCHDLAVDTRGRAFLRLCEELDLRILNGTRIETSTPGALTSFQTHGSTTIDYLITSARATVDVKNLGFTPDNNSDHARVRFSARVSPHLLPCAADGDSSTSIEYTRYHLMREKGALDVELQQLLQSICSEEEAIEELYGPVYADGTPSAVYIAVHSNGDYTRVAAFWGARSRWNRIWVLCTDRINDALCVAGLLAIREPSSRQPLTVYTSSEWLIRAVCFRAGKLAKQGWDANSGDALRALCRCLASRHASTHWTKCPKGEYMRAARALAGLPITPTDANDAILLHNLDCLLPVVVPPAGSVVRLTGKVQTTLPRDPPTARPYHSLAPGIDDVDLHSESHRSRAHDRHSLWENMERLRNAAKKSSAAQRG